MSWHFLPELAAEYSAGICSDGDVSVLSSTTSMQETCCSQDKETDTCQGSQSGATLEHSTENLGEAWLISYLADFRVRTLVPQEKEQASKENAQDYGRKWLELSVKYDRDLHSWKTHRCLFDEDLPQSSVILPKWGMMRRGVLFRLRTAEHPTCESEYGLWVSTPTASMTKRSEAFREGRLPTPQEFATPTARDWKDNGKSPAELARNSETLASQAGGTLNPNWVEWLMGWPVGWTDCDVLETGKFQSWQQQHGVS